MCRLGRWSLPLRKPQLKPHPLEPCADTSCKVSPVLCPVFPREVAVHVCDVCVCVQASARGGGSAASCMVSYCSVCVCVWLCVCVVGCAVVTVSTDDSGTAGQLASERASSLQLHMGPRPRFPPSRFPPPHGPRFLRGPPQRFMMQGEPFMHPPGPDFMRMPPHGE